MSQFAKISNRSFRNWEQDFLNTIIPKGNQEFSANWIQHKDISMLILSLGRQALISQSNYFSDTFVPKIDQFTDLRGSEQTTRFIKENGTALKPFPISVSLKVEKLTNKPPQLFEGGIFNLSKEDPKKSIHVVMKETKEHAEIFEYFAISLIPDSWKGEEDLKGFVFEIPKTICFRGHEKHASSLTPALNEERAKIETVAYRILELNRSQQAKFSIAKAEKIWEIWQKFYPVLQEFKDKKMDANQLEKQFDYCFEMMANLEEKIIQLRQLGENPIQQHYLQLYKKDWEGQKEQLKSYIQKNQPKATEELKQLSEQSVGLVGFLQELVDLGKGIYQTQSFSVSQKERTEFLNTSLQALERRKDIIEGKHHSSSNPTVRLCVYTSLNTCELLAEALRHVLLELFQFTLSYQYLTIDFKNKDLRENKLSLFQGEFNQFTQGIKFLGNLEEVTQKWYASLAQLQQMQGIERNTANITDEQLIARQEIEMIQRTLSIQKSLLETQQEIAELEMLHKLILEQEKLFSFENNMRSLGKRLRDASDKYIEKLVDQFNTIHQSTEATLMQNYRSSPLAPQLLSLMLKRINFMDKALLKNGLVKKENKNNSVILTYTDKFYAKQRYIFDQQLTLIIWNLLFNAHQTNEKNWLDITNAFKDFLDELNLPTVYPGSESTKQTSFQKLINATSKVLKKIEQSTVFNSNSNTKELKNWLEKMNKIDFNRIAMQEVENYWKQFTQIKENLLKQIKTSIQQDFNQRVYEEKRQALTELIKKSIQPKTVSKEYKELLGKFISTLQGKIGYKSSKAIKELGEKIRALKESLTSQELLESKYSAQLAKDMTKEIEHLEMRCTYDFTQITKEEAINIRKEIEKDTHLKDLAKEFNGFITFIENYLEQKNLEDVCINLEVLNLELIMDAWLTCHNGFKTFTRCFIDDVSLNPNFSLNDTHIPSHYFFIDS